jgi:hypothetical protein
LICSSEHSNAALTFSKGKRCECDVASSFQVGLASGEGNYTDIVREAQKSVKLPNVILVDAIGLPLRDDQLHLSTEAQLQLGDMLAQAYLKFNSSTDPVQ